MRASPRALLALPGAVLPLLPAVTCPFCLSAYAGVVSTLGLGFLVNERVLLPLIAFFLGVSVSTVGWTTRSHRKKGPIAASIAGATLVVGGRIAFDVPVAVYLGVAMLLAGSGWNLWLKRRTPSPLVRLGTRSTMTSIETEAR